MLKKKNVKKKTLKVALRNTMLTVTNNPTYIFLSIES